MKIGIIGAGSLGKTIIDGLCEEKDLQIRASQRSESEYKGINIEAGTNKDICTWADVVILAVKPKFMTEVITEIKDLAQEKIIISVAAILDLQYYEEQGIPHIIRTMPNIAIGKKAGVIGFTASKECSEETKKEAKELFSRMGYVAEVAEEQLDTIIALSGSGIAYLTRIIGHFIDEGIAKGMSKAEATNIMMETVKGSNALLATGEEAESICARVATKGGITEQGLALMKKEGIGKIIHQVTEKTIQACKGK